MGIAAFEPRYAFNRSERLEILRKPGQQLLAQVGVRDFPPAELHHGFHAIAFFEKAYRMVLFEIVIVIVGVRTEFQLLYLDHVLLLARVVLLFLLLVLIVAVIDGLGDRWNGSGRNQYQ